MNDHPLEETWVVFCPRCKKKTEFTRIMHRKYICSECNLKFDRKDYSKLLRKYVSEK